MTRPRASRRSGKVTVHLDDMDDMRNGAFLEEIGLREHLVAAGMAGFRTSPKCSALSIDHSRLTTTGML